MTGTPFEAASGRLSESWAATILTPASLFWAGGAAAVIWARAAGDRGWLAVAAWFAAQPVATQIAALIAALILVTVSGFAVRAVTLPFMRLLEGYWPRWLGRPRRALVRWQAPSQADEDSWQGLAGRVGSGTASDDQVRRFTMLDQRLRRVPVTAAQRMPSRLGNVLAAAEAWPLDKYGLDSPTCWPRLWLVLPEASRQQLSATRGDLDAAVGVCLWGLLFVVWAPWAWWAAPVGLLISYAAYRRAVQVAEVYGDLVESAFDVHRNALYDALRWPRPAGPDQEPESGAQLAAYLRRGTAPSNLQWAPPTELTSPDG